MKANYTSNKVRNHFFKLLFKYLRLVIRIVWPFLQFSGSPVSPFWLPLARTPAANPVGSHVPCDDSGFDVEENLAASSCKTPLLHWIACQKQNKIWSVIDVGTWDSMAGWSFLLIFCVKKRQHRSLFPSLIVQVLVLITLLETTRSDGHHYVDGCLLAWQNRSHITSL